MITFEPPTPPLEGEGGGQHVMAGLLLPLQILNLFVFLSQAFDSISQVQKQLSETICSFAFFIFAITF